MNIEIVEFYPIERNEDKGFLNGTLRIRLLDIGIDILGVYASKNINGWSFRLPNGKSINHETGAPCWYPFLSFQDKEKQVQLMGAIRENGQEFIEARLADKEKPLVFLGKPSFQKKQTLSPKVKETSPDLKETMLVDKEKSVPSIASKVWVDPPPRKIATAHKMRTGRTI